MTGSDLAGRTRELALLEEVLGGRSDAVLVVVGDPGIGKSALLREFERLAQSAGFVVLTTIGVEAEAQLPFAGLHQILRPVLRDADGLPAAERDALLSAFGLCDGPRPELFLIARAAIRLLASVADRTRVAVVADDVQWLDPQTHETLVFIARRAEEARIVVVGALRTGYPGPFLAAGFQDLVVGGVDDDAAEHILLTHAKDLSSADRRRIQREAAGNPLALRELPTVRRAQGAATSDLQMPSLSARLERAFGSRLRELPDTTRDAVLVAAVDWADDVAEIVAATAVLSGEPVAADVVAPAVETGLVRVSGDRLAFRHPLMRSGVLSAESLRRRQAANAALAEVLVHDPYRRTWHRAQSILGPDDEIADELEASVGVSLRRGAVVSAISNLERSAQLTSSSARRGHRLLVAAEHAFGLGRADLVDRLVKDAVRSDLTDLDQARVQWLREIFNDGVPGDATRVTELCDLAYRSAAADDLDLALNLLLGAAMRCWWADTGPAARARVVEVAESLPGVADDPRFVATIAVAEPVLKGADVSRLLNQAMVDAPDAPDAPDALDDGDTLRLLGMAAHVTGDSPRAADLLDRAEVSLREQGRLGLLAHVLSMQVVIRLELGDWTRAAAAADEGLRVAEDTGQPIWSTGTIVCDARAKALSGAAERALAMAAQAELAANRQRLNDLLACVQLARGLAWFTTGRYGEAYSALRGLFDPADPSFHQRQRFDGVMFLAEAAGPADRRDDARQVIADLEQVAAITPAPLLHVQLLYARAVLADGPAAEDLFRAGLAQDLSRWPWVRARIQLAYGMWLRRAGHRDGAPRHLRGAHETLVRIGAASWAELARSELARALR